MRCRMSRILSFFQIFDFSEKYFDGKLSLLIFKTDNWSRCASFGQQ